MDLWNWIMESWEYGWLVPFIVLLILYSFDKINIPIVVCGVIVLRLIPDSELTREDWMIVGMITILLMLLDYASLLLTNDTHKKDIKSSQLGILEKYTITLDSNTIVSSHPHNNEIPANPTWYVHDDPDSSLIMVYRYIDDEWDHYRNINKYNSFTFELYSTHNAIIKLQYEWCENQLQQRNLK